MKEPICPKHKLKISNCNCKEMQYKEAYKIPPTLANITDSELEMVWWAAFSRDDLSTIFCDTKTLRAALLRILNAN